ncbi:MAG TPA: tRNA pseudouridine(55) synthase TruB [Gemmatimonadales bacterium]|nr:tRNA pseudouridine(55) synthase TruB [Gemmatimonadales bacterium]
MTGAVLVDKPAGPTSHDVVARARRALGERSIGHTGTLDPFATGLLVLLVGKATRVARFLDGLAKTYLAVARLGQRTATDDLTGEPLGGPHDGPLPDRASVEAALAGFAGPQAQVPPAFSARRQDGERAYARARRGAEVQLPATAVTVYAAELLSVAGAEVSFRVTVSTGTYIRALARDLGERLGTGAHLTALRRESIGSLQVADALPLDALGAGTKPWPVGAVLSHLPRVPVNAAGRMDIAHGRPVAGSESGTVAVLSGNEVIAVAEGDGTWLRPTVVLTTP